MASTGSSSEERIPTTLADGFSGPHSLRLPSNRLNLSRLRKDKRPASSSTVSHGDDFNQGRFKKLAEIPGASTKDDHLSIKFEDIVNGRMKRLHYVLRCLTESQKDDVQAIGFAGLLHMDIENLPTQMFDWLVNGFNPSSRQFYVNGTPSFVVSGWDVAGTFGLNYSPSSQQLEEDENDDEVQQILKKWKSNYGLPEYSPINISDLEASLSVLDSGGPDFKWMFVLFVLHSLLIPTATNNIRVGLLKSLVNVERIRHLNWGGFVIDHLCESVQRYKELGSKVGVEGCILLLMITYFQECPWQSIPKQMYVPLIQHWPDFRINQRISEEISGGGFGRGKYDNSFAWPIMEPTDHLPSHQAPLENISFVLHDDFHGDHELSVIFPNENDRVVATIIRDMNAVFFGHVERNNHLTNLLKEKGLSLDQMNSASPATLNECVMELISNLGVLHGALSHTEDDEPLAELKSNITQAICANEDSDPNSPWLLWPANPGRVYLSKLVSRYAARQASLPPHELEIADYCIGDDTNFNEREHVFYDGGRGWLLRRDLRTLDYGVQVSPVIIDVWAGIMNYTWEKQGTRKASTCLATMNEVNDISIGLFFGKLCEWMQFSKVDIGKAEMVFVPINFRSHFYLLAIDFKAKKLHSIDDVVHSDQQQWDTITLRLAFCVLDFMGRGGDRRADVAKDFTYELLHPVWSYRRYEYECGIAVMVAIETFNGSPRDFHGLGFHMEDVRVEKRVTCLSRIVVTLSNQCRETVLSEVNRFILDKVNLLTQSKLASSIAHV